MERSGSLTSRLRLSAWLVAAMLALGMVLAACGGDDGAATDSAANGQQEQDARSQEESGADDAPAGSDDPESAGDGPAPVGEGSTEPRESDGFPSVTGPTAQLVDVRLASHPEGGDHPAFDRLVLEFEGEQRPEWRIAYSDGPVRQDGSGHVVELPGDAFLEVRVVPASGVDLRGEEARQTYTGPDRIPLEGAVVSEAARAGDFEAHLTWALGIQRRAPFAIAWLEDPMRLVVDVMAVDG